MNRIRLDSVLTVLGVPAGYVTIFLLALLTDRAFLIHEHPSVHARWETIYGHPHVDWRAERALDYEAAANSSDFYLLDLWCVSSLLLVPGYGSDAQRNTVAGGD